MRPPRYVRVVKGSIVDGVEPSIRALLKERSTADIGLLTTGAIVAAELVATDLSITVLP